MTRHHTAVVESAVRGGLCTLLVLWSSTSAAQTDQPADYVPFDIPMPTDAIAMVGGWVTAFGDYQSTVPIEVPPFHGLEPRLTLTYNSLGAASSGGVAVGWRLSGVSTIQRMGQGRGAPRYDASDVFFLDGEELVPCLTLGGTHCTKLQRHLRIRYDSGNWFVWRKDGTKLTYTPVYGVGHGTFRWQLASVLDTHNNAVSYTYWCDPGADCYPDTITYNGNVIKFYWATMFYPETFANGEYLGSTRYRLNAIDVTANGIRLRAYGLQADWTSRTKRPILRWLNHYGKDATFSTSPEYPPGSLSGGHAFPPLAFTYDDASYAGTATYVSAGPDFSANYDATPSTWFLPGDFDGDGKTDFIAIHPSSAGAYANTFLSRGNGRFTQVPAAMTTPGAPPYWAPPATTKFFVGDFNGDGKTDFIAFHFPDSSSTYANTFLSNGDGTLRPPVPTGILPTMQLLSPGDFNGDGMTDFIAVDQVGSSQIPWVLYSSGDGTFSFHQAVYESGVDAYPVLTGEDRILGDFDGDGRTDFIAVWRGPNTRAETYLSSSRGSAECVFRRVQTNIPGGAWADSKTRFVVGDFNGDGKSDFIAVYTSTGAVTFLSNGDGTFTQVPVSSIADGLSTCGYNSLVAGDFDGDGRSDLLIIQPQTIAGPVALGGCGGGDLAATTVARTLLSLGNGSFAAVDTEGPWQWPGTPGGYWTDQYTRFLPGDFDGDGKKDFIAVQPNRTPYYQLPATYAMTFLMNGPPGHLLRSIDNGLGLVTSVTYTSSSAWQNFNNLSLLPTVTRIQSDSGNGVSAVETRSYSGGYYHSAQREFRGYNYVSALSPQGPHLEQANTRTWFHQGDDGRVDASDRSAIGGSLRGRPYRTQVWDVQGSTYTEALISYWSGAAPSYFAPPYEVIRRACRKNPDSSTTCGADARTTFATFDAAGSPTLPYDSYGNLLRVNEYGDVTLSEDDRTTVNTYTVNSASYIVNLKAFQTVYAGTGPNTLIDPANRIQQSTYEYDGQVPVTAGTECTSYTPSASVTIGNLSRVVKWLNGGVDPESWFGYNAAGSLRCISDADRRVTSFRYDSSSTYLTNVINAKLHVTKGEYYGVDGVPVDTGVAGQLKRVIDSNGIATTFEYDELGRIVKETLPPVAAPLAGEPFPGFSRTTSYVLGPVGTHRTEISTSAGAWGVRYFDGVGRTYLIKTRASATGRTFATQMRFNPTGTVAGISLPYEDVTGAPIRWTSYTYDGRGRATQITRPDGTPMARCFDDVGRSCATIDANKHKRRFNADVAGNIVSLQEYLGSYDLCAPSLDSPFSTTTYEYDRMSRLRAVIDAHGNRVETDYDTLGRQAFLSDPDLGNLIYQYSAAGDLISQQDGNPIALQLSYDELHRIKSRTYADGRIVTYSYDDASVPYSKGLLTSVASGVVTTSYGYDSVGRLWKTTLDLGGTAYTTLTDYDTAGRVARVTYPDPSHTVVTYTYDADGYLWTISDPSRVYATITGYNALGRPHSVAFGNGVTTTYTYNDSTDNRLASITTASQTGSGLLSLALSYDKVGNVTGVTDALNSAASQAFVYDELDRMVGAGSGYRAPPAINYTYDPIRVHAVSRSSEGTIYAYDANGNMTSDGVRTIQYNADNTIALVRLRGATTTFTYDGNGDRVMKETGANTSVYAGKLYECTGGVCIRHVFANGRRIASVSSDGTVRYYHPDHIGSTRVVTGQPADATVPVAAIEQLLFHPFGSTVADSAPQVTPYKFTSQELDPETGIYNYNARYYNPGLGRFLSPDPSGPSLGDPQTLNRYSYARNNPATFTDPSGYQSEDGNDEDFPPVDGEPSSDEYVGCPVEICSISRTYSPQEPEPPPEPPAEPPALGDYLGTVTAGPRGGAAPVTGGGEPGRSGFWWTHIPQDELHSPPGKFYAPSIMPDYARLFAKIWELLGGADAAEYATRHYAKLGNSVGGSLAVLGTKQLAPTTVAVLQAGGAAGVWAGRPFWQYYPAGVITYRSGWLTRGWGWEPPYASGATARSALALPPWNIGTAVRPIQFPWYRFVAGPRLVESKFGLPGGGMEYFNGFLFP